VLIENCVLQMLVYEFMPNGTLRDHLSGEYTASHTFTFTSFFSPHITMLLYIKVDHAPSPIPRISLVYLSPSCTGAALFYLSSLCFGALCAFV
jgi:hypothetical protein